MKSEFKRYSCRAALAALMLMFGASWALAQTTKIVKCVDAAGNVSYGSACPAGVAPDKEMEFRQMTEAERIAAERSAAYWRGRADAERQQRQQLQAARAEAQACREPNNNVADPSACAAAKKGCEFDRASRFGAGGKNRCAQISRACRTNLDIWRAKGGYRCSDRTMQAETQRQMVEMEDRVRTAEAQAMDAKLRMEERVREAELQAMEAELRMQNMRHFGHP